MTSSPGEGDGLSVTVLSGVADGCVGVGVLAPSVLQAASDRVRKTARHAAPAEYRFFTVNHLPFGFVF